MLKSLKGKILIPGIIVLSLIALSIYLFVSQSTTNLAHTLAQERILGVTRSATAYLDRLKIYAHTASTAISSSHRFIELMEAEDREEMITYLTLRTQSLNVDGFVVADAYGNVIIRTHDTDRYGDSITGMACVAAAMQGVSTAAFTTNPAVPMAISSARPIYDAYSRLIGVVSSNFIISTDEFVDFFGDIFNSEVTVFHGYTVAASTVLDEHGQRTTGLPVASMYVAHRVMWLEEHFQTVISLYGMEHHAYYFPLRDAGGAVIGMFFVGVSNEQTLAVIADVQFALLVIGIVGLSAMVIVLSVIIALRLRPLENLTRSVSQISAESMTVYGIGRTDEIGLLAAAIQNMLQDVNAAREKEYQHKISEKDRETNALTQKFFDAAPAFIEIWDENFNLVDCNKKTAELFGLSDPAEFVRDYARFSPKYQPCGTLSEIKWVALANGAFYVFTIISSLIFGPILYAFQPPLALLNFIIICGPDLLEYLRPLRVRSSPQVISYKKAAKKAKREQSSNPYRHKCTVCGKTDMDYPNLEFRYCSRCNGYYCFCVEHINDHIHFQ